MNGDNRDVNFDNSDREEHDDDETQTEEEEWKMRRKYSRVLLYIFRMP